MKSESIFLRFLWPEKTASVEMLGTSRPCSGSPVPGTPAHTGKLWQQQLPGDVWPSCRFLVVTLGGYNSLIRVNLNRTQCPPTGPSPVSMVPKGGLGSEAPHIAGDTHTPELPSQGFLEVPIDFWVPMTCL